MASVPCIPFGSQHHYLYRIYSWVSASLFFPPLQTGPCSDHWPPAYLPPFIGWKLPWCQTVYISVCHPLIEIEDDTTGGHVGILLILLHQTFQALKVVLQIAAGRAAVFNTPIKWSNCEVWRSVAPLNLDLWPLTQTDWFTRLESCQHLSTNQISLYFLSFLRWLIHISLTHRPRFQCLRSQQCHLWLW